MDPCCHFFILLPPGVTDVLPGTVLLLLDRPDDYHLLLTQFPGLVRFFPSIVSMDHVNSILLPEHVLEEVV
jgi:hypothetical protein